MILPTVIILLITLAIMTTVIPYAFHVVIKQLQSHYGEDENSMYPNENKLQLRYVCMKSPEIVFLVVISIPAL